VANIQEQGRKQDFGTFSPNSRSSWKVSLRRKGSLTQASSSRLSERSKSGNNGLHVLLLRWDLLAWARWTLA